MMKRSTSQKLHSVHSAVTAGFPVRLHLRNDLHLARKVWHMLTGMAIAYCYMAGMSTATALMILSAIFVWDFSMEIARLRVPSLNEKILKIWGPVMRTSEVNRMSGIPYYLLSSIIAIAVFPKPIAILSILYLAFGDPMASLFGILYGKKGPRFANGKSLIGTLAGVATCALITFIFLKTLPIAAPLAADETVILLSLIGGFAGGTVELLPLDLDDNFTIPVVSGFVLWLAFLIVGL